MFVTPSSSLGDFHFINSSLEIKSVRERKDIYKQLTRKDITDSIFVNGFSNSLVLHLCVSHFTLDLSEKHGDKISHLYLQSVDGIAGFLPRIVKNTKNLSTLVLSDCYWIGRLALTSHTLEHFTLYKVVGLEILHLKCRNLRSLVYHECNLSILPTILLISFLFLFQI